MRLKIPAYLVLALAILTPFQNCDGPRKASISNTLPSVTSTMDNKYTVQNIELAVGGAPEAQLVFIDHGIFYSTVDFQFSIPSVNDGSIVVTSLALPAGTLSKSYIETCPGHAGVEPTGIGMEDLEASGGYFLENSEHELFIEVAGFTADPAAPASPASVRFQVFVRNGGVSALNFENAICAYVARLPSIGTTSPH